MTVKVKVCGITKLKDAKFALLAGAKYLGFIFYAKSPRNISLEKSQLILEDLVNFSFGRVAVDVCPTPESVMQMKEVGFDFFQFHFPYDFDLSKIRQWSELVGTSNLWLAPKLPPGSNFPEKLLEYAENFVIDSYSVDKFGGTGNPSDWESFSNYQKRYSDKKWILAGGMGPENIVKSVRQLNVKYVDINSTVEISPGIKDHVKIKNLFLCLEELEI
ncbi:MAG: phosphoribosylanthranilate isomerase [Opitutae bacterium]|nr:phosphoribosylanthranilate isomerase [Opitutae bacterium]